MQRNPRMPVWKRWANVHLPGPNDIHIWRVDLHRIDFEGKMDFQLPEIELLAAGNRQLEADCKRYIASRYVLRSLLGRYTGRNPGELEFTTNSYNKPFLKDSKLQFNLTHSDNIIIIAIGYADELGVDVEHIKPAAQLLQIMKRIFSPVEVHELMKNDQQQLLKAFYTGWTKKEAYVKAKGKGLSIPLKSFAIGSGNEAAIIYSRLYEHDRDTFVFRTFTPEKDFVATVAVASRCSLFAFYEMVLPLF